MSIRPDLLDPPALPGRAAAGAPARTSAAVCVTVAMTSVAVATVYMTQPILGVIASRFSVSADAARSAFAWPLLSYAVVFFLVGPLSDRLRASTLASGGGLALGALLIAAGQVGDFAAFLATLIAAGAAAACVPAATFALVARVARPDRLGFYFGLAIAATVVGVTLGRTLGALLAAGLGLAGLFTAAGGALAAVAFALLAIGAPDSPPAARTGLVAAYRRTLAVVRDRRAAALLGAGVLLFVGYLGLLTFLTLRLRAEPFLYSTAEIGWISATGLVAVVGAPGAGALIAKVGARAVAAGSLAVVLVGLAALGLSAGTATVAFGLVALFLGVFACQPAILVLLSSRVPATSKGATASLYLLACLVGGSVASLALGPVWLAFGWSGVTAAALISVGSALVLVAAHRP